jgi:DNA transformation protein
MFALEADGELYLKADAATLEVFRAAGSRAFTYDKNGRTARMSYWRLPDAAVDDPDEAARWGRLALDAARRATKANSK